ncbi:MAG: D-alanine--D-alanine ligase [bacterium]|nr:D-alanine--D-alanine ligase [bacterium]
MKIGLIFGGRSVEHQVSIRSARTVGAALEEAGHEVISIGIARDGCWLSPSEASRAMRGEVDFLDAPGGAIAPSVRILLDADVDAVFPLVHGTWGEDGSLQGLCEMAGLAYVGADVTASAVAMDKLLTKRLLEAVGIPVVEYEVVTRLELENDRGESIDRVRRFGFPQFIKPAVGGSSVGVSKLETEACVESSLELALRLDDSAIVERAMTGRELECSVIGYPHLEASAVGEIRPGQEFYDYADKYLEEDAELLIPAELDPEEEALVRSLAVRSFEAIGGTGMARVDFFLDGDIARVNEINTLPGFTSISMYPKLWEAAGVPLVDLVGRLVDEGVARHRDRVAIDGEIKAFLEGLER